MGNKYYCDYCDKTMVATPSIIRTHTKGVVHQKLVNEHYQQYKDPETILNEEINKKPCIRFARGECQFGGVCRYSHYTHEQLNILQNHVATKNRSKLDNNQPSFEDLYHQLQNNKSANKTNEKNTIVYDENGITHVLPWNYNSALDSYGDLPLSIRRMKTSDFENIFLTNWG